MLFIAGFGPTVPDRAARGRRDGEDFGVELKEEPGGDRRTERLAGAKAFALGPLSQAAQSCFGTGEWPPGLPAPQGWLELEVDRREPTTEELELRGYRRLVRSTSEPWGRVSRLLSPDGPLLGVTCTPRLRQTG